MGDKTKKIKVLNGLPLGAMPQDAEVLSYELGLEDVKSLLKQNEYESYIGHEDTAAVLSNLLGVPIVFNRVSATFDVGDTIITCAYSGPRLSEGTRVLPEGARFRFFVSEIRRRINVLELYNRGFSVRDIARAINRSTFYVYELIRGHARDYELSNKLRKLKNLRLRLKNDILNEKDMKLLKTLKSIDEGKRYSYLKSYFGVDEDYEIIKEIYDEIVKLLG